MKVYKAKPPFTIEVSYQEAWELVQAFELLNWLARPEHARRISTARALWSALSKEITK